MPLFDTNMFDLMILGDPNVLHRVQESKEPIWLSSVAAEERLIGYMGGLNRARAPRTSLSLVRAHEDFVQSLHDLRLLPILVFSEEAEQIYRTFPASIIRVGAQDCRIAAQALAHGLTVITRNTRDFEAIGAPCADWSV